MTKTNLHKLQARAKLLGLAGTGTEAQLRRRIDNYWNRRAKKRKPQKRRKRPETKRRRRPLTFEEELRKKRRLTPLETKQNLQALIGASFSPTKGGLKHKVISINMNNRKYPVISVNENGTRYKWSVQQMKRYLPSSYFQTRGAKERKNKERRIISAAQHPLSQRIGSKAAWKTIKPTDKNELREILSYCGPQCFADVDHTVPICPKCDGMQCYCHPECTALLTAYQKGYDKDTMVRYGKMLRCGWVPAYDTELPIMAAKNKKESNPRKRALADLAAAVPNLIGIQIITTNMAALFTKTGTSWVLQTIAMSGKSNIADNLNDDDVKKVIQNIPYKGVRKIQTTTEKGKTHILYERL